MSEKKAYEPCIAVIGSGYWGKNLVRNHHALGSLRSICDSNEAVLKLFQEQYPGVRTCSSLTDVLGDDAVRGVVISTPAPSHFDIVREVLLAGKHVYVEKPFVLDEDEGRELIALAREKGLCLMVGHLLHYHPAFQELKRLVRGGELGKINYIYSNRLNLGKIRREENILWSFAPHDISMILALTGEMPDAVKAEGGSWLHSRIADVTTTHLSFPSGIKAHIFVSWLHPFKEQRLVVVGEKQMAVFDDTLPWAEKLQLYPHCIDWKDNVPTPCKANPVRVDLPESEPLRRECEHFLECIRENKRPVTDGEEGLRVLEVLNRAQRSLELQPEADRLLAAPAAPKPAAPAKPDGGYFAHQTAEVDEGVEIGKGTRIWHFSHIIKGSRIGERCNVGQNVVIGPDVVVGDGCKIQNNVSVYPGVTLEDEVFCGPSMVFTNVFNPRSHIPRKNEIRSTLVRKGATLGANSTIVCGITIGRYAFVGAGAVVTRDVPAHALLMGNPARRTGWMCSCGEKLPESLRCGVCGTVYRKDEDGLSPLS
ncbi:Gfo/Idh/MocA family oxidoreductase [Paucidesulfovibrio longus]|uniref:Gfo/Idh/MocA family oxidoreductase n=1 Tax=Paucidesulfovibrio longus TaxID=889 RepID=UPI0003B4FDDD|nr:Gfo/Idh/MocA family oxidoreductase [Paucidesulfovibrio longus]